jgi:hypothetical protein
MATYAEQIAQWRQQRAQQQVNNRLQEIRQEHAQVVRERDQAIADNDMETAEFRDQDCQQLEQEWAHYNPPQADPRLVQFGQRNQDYLNKLRARVGPERAGQFLNWLDQRLVNIGLQRNSPAYFERGRDMLELDSARVTGVPYDSNTQALTADEAAKISGLDAKTYNSYAAAYQKAKAQGRVG